MTIQRRDRRVLRAAADLEAVAANVATARDLIGAELWVTDGQVGAQTFNDGGRSADGTTSVERVVIRRASLRAEVVGFDVTVDAIVALVQHLSRASNRAIGTRVAPLEVPRCHSEPGLAGYLVPLADGGWFDPLCTNVPRYRVGRCDACRKRFDRWRVRNGQPVLADERDVEFESKVVAGELGVVHVRPVVAA